ncbi:dynein axonemal assembly factor 11-like [Uloborus diversus]|uniref:dynein axonemal assembly factor 11-like n=1 Tax=Uloborus diversus TaxID=327109 RepID=UPI002408F640|nr:dynein axonemal assembly factor 11-like [Uloborus diversus]
MPSNQESSLIVHNDDSSMATEFSVILERMQEMATITEELVRKCAEHNEREIFSLEELSLHQRNIIKIQNIDRWCRDLKILYLHSNLISKIENLSRLKKLEYANFTLNNITKIENLEGCESLRKLDFTANFIGELTSVEGLSDNFNLEELYLTGNPCTEFEGYRQYVIAALPQLTRLDGQKIKKSERILAMQVGINIETSSHFSEDSADEEVLNLENEKRFWKEKTSHTPQTRIDIYKQIEKSKRKDSVKEKNEKPSTRFTTDDGRILNMNEPKIDFDFIDDEENNCYRLDLAIYRYLDTSLLEVDVQPNYVRVKVKGKYFQLLLPQEVHPDISTSLRSQTTGHLLITMPKANKVLKKRENKERSKCFPNKLDSELEVKKEEGNNTLEVTPTIIDTIHEIAHHTSDKNDKTSCVSETEPLPNEDKEFIDNPDVPPLI